MTAELVLVTHKSSTDAFSPGKFRQRFQCIENIKMKLQKAIRII